MYPLLGIPACFLKQLQRRGQIEPKVSWSSDSGKAAKQQGVEQEKPDGTDRGEALVSHTLQTPSQIPQRAHS